MQRYIFWWVPDRYGRVSQIVRINPDLKTSKVMMAVDPAEDCRPSKYFKGMEPLELVAESIRLLGIGNASTVDLAQAFDECADRRKKIAENSRNPLKRAREDKRDTIRALRAQGVSIRDIARLTGVSRSTVHRVCAVPENSVAHSNPLGSVPGRSEAADLLA